MALAYHEELLRRLRAPSRPRAAPAAPVPPAPSAPEVTLPVPTAEIAETAETAEPPLLRKPPRRNALARHEWRFDPLRPVRHSRSKGHTVDFKACCGDPEPEPEPEPEPDLPTNLPASLEITLPKLDVRVPLSADESYLKDWYDESTKECTEEHVWVDADKEDVATVSFTEDRLNEIGIESSASARLFWIQDKPEEFANRFGHWDPVGARWRILTKHSVVPVEQRIAPVGVGYGSTHAGERCCDNDSFASHEYNETQDIYTSTALHAGLSYISAQLNALPKGTTIPVASGWGSDAAGQSVYYTPNLRHLSIDHAIAEEEGKRYVYLPGIGTDRNPVKPMPVEACWSSANACWISGASSHELGCDDERAADALLRSNGRVGM